MEHAILQPPSEARSVQGTGAMNSSISLPHQCPITTNNMITGYIIFLAGVSIPVGLALQPGTPVDMQWILMTLAGAMVASSAAFLLNRTKEPPRIVIGRALVSATIGVVGTRLAYHWLDWVRNLLTVDPTLMFGAGAAAGLLGYIIAVPAIRTGFHRAPEAVDKQFDRWLQDGDKTQPLPNDINHASNGKNRRD